MSVRMNGGRYHTGEALAWSKLDFTTRQRRIRDVVIQGFFDNGANQVTENALKAKLGRRDVLLVINAIPGALSVSAAREMIAHRATIRDCANTFHIPNGIGFE